MNRRRLLYFFLTGFLVIGCKERFEPNLPALSKSYLVVEGSINGGDVPTRITLSRSSPVNTPKNFLPEENALVIVEGEDNSSQSLTNSGDGAYLSSGLTLNQSIRYRVKILTGGKEYVSEYVSIKSTPPIDSINWIEEDGGVNIYANTHDPQNNTRYYRWNFEETWEIHSAFSASYRYVDGVVRPTNSSIDPDIYFCWKYDHSKYILVGSSAKLETDVIFRQPLLSMRYGEERIGVRYSILVRQYAIEKQEYDFLSQMKKNTESLGTIFDPQPSALRGNIRCVTDPDDPVVGYVGASVVREQRIFIRAAEISAPRFKMTCPTDTIPVDSIYFAVPASLPYNAVQRGPSIDSYLVSTPRCVDCTLRGTNVKPSFW
ncbi:MAG TPA: DUF4249 domain-containing protein [Chitinophagaceae bacterium]|nr:DUF4249 domain-containing protein [Chitinophagaceae bacterium]